MEFRLKGTRLGETRDGDGTGASAASAKGPERIAVGVPLGKILPRQLVDSPDLVVRRSANSVAAEKFRRLKTILENDVNGAPQVIVVTSATPREGKSFVAINVALSFASDQKGQTLLLDADLRRPSVDRWLSPAPSLGLTEVLAGQADLDHAIISVKDTSLQILPAGKPASNPVDLLASETCRTLLDELRRRYVRIVVDTPPIVPFTDADVIGRCADGLLIVVRARQTPSAAYKQAVSMVTSTRILGCVLNDVVFNLADRDRYYGKYYDHYYSDRSKK